jgi:mono/diheme cytochrome c family protein
MSARRLLPLLAIVPILAGCGGGTEFTGEEGKPLAKSDPLYEGAQIFNERCGGCHTFDAADTEGSAVRVNGREYKDGPNFNQRREQYEDVIYAIENGGFSSGPMPQNIVVGEQAKVVACFVATYSGQDATREASPGNAINVPKTKPCRDQLASSSAR